MPVIRRLAPTAAVIVMALTAVAGRASADADPARAQLQQQEQAQLQRMPGGVVKGDTITYPDLDVTLVYWANTATTTSTGASTAAGSGVAQALAASVTPDSLPGDGGACPDGEVCLFTQTSLTNQALITGSVWCPPENSRGWLDLANYGLQNNVRSVNNMGSWYAQGVWQTMWGQGSQWKVYPNSYSSSVSPNNIRYVQVCKKEGDWF